MLSLRWGDLAATYYVLRGPSSPPPLLLISLALSAIQFVRSHFSLVATTTSNLLLSTIELLPSSSPAPSLAESSIALPSCPLQCAIHIHTNKYNMAAAVVNAPPAGCCRRTVAPAAGPQQLVPPPRPSSSAALMMPSMVVRARSPSRAAGGRRLVAVAAVGDVSAEGSTYLIAGAVAVALVGTAFPILFSRKDTYVMTKSIALYM